MSPPEAHGSHRYVIVTPARDEEATIEETLRSVRAQTVPPERWVIVDDGSSDGTVARVRPHLEATPWMRLVERGDRGFRALGGGVVDAFDEGLRHVADVDWDFVVKLDADLRFEPDYFERLLACFDSDPGLGMASGKTFLIEDGRKRIEWCHDEHVRGPAKMYRRECFEAIGGLEPVRGWDMIDETRAQMLGWRTRSFLHLELVHLRPIDARQSHVLRSRFRMGELYHYLGYHPLYHLVRGLRSAVQDYPRPLGGLALLAGYAWAALRRRPTYDPEYVAFVRARQRARFSWTHLRGFLRSVAGRDAS